MDSYCGNKSLDKLGRVRQGNRQSQESPTATPTRAKPHQSSLETPTLLIPGLSSPPPRAGTHPVTNWFVETPSMPTPGHGSPPPRAGIQPATYGS